MSTKFCIVFYHLPSFSTFGSDLYYKIHAPPLQHRFSLTLPPSDADIISGSSLVDALGPHLAAELPQLLRHAGLVAAAVAAGEVGRRHPTVNAAPLSCMHKVGKG